MQLSTKTFYDLRNYYPSCTTGENSGIEELNIYMTILGIDDSLAVIHIFPDTGVGLLKYGAYTILGKLIMGLLLSGEAFFFHGHVGHMSEIN